MIGFGFQRCELNGLFYFRKTRALEKVFALMSGRGESVRGESERGERVREGGGEETERKKEREKEREKRGGG